MFLRGEPASSRDSTKRVAFRLIGHRLWERDFMARLVFHGSSRHLELLEVGLPDKEWTSRLRSNWSRFIAYNRCCALLKTSAQLKLSCTSRIGQTGGARTRRKTRRCSPGGNRPINNSRSILRIRAKVNLMNLPSALLSKLMDHSGICYFSITCTGLS